MSLHRRMIILVAVAVTGGMAVVAAGELADRAVPAAPPGRRGPVPARHPDPDRRRRGPRKFATDAEPSSPRSPMYRSSTPPAGRPPHSRRRPAVDGTDRAVAREQANRHVRTVRVAGRSLRALTVPRANGTAIQFAEPLADMEQSLAALRWILIGIALAGSGAAAGIATAVARAGLRPVERVTTAAERIAATQDLTGLIPVSGSDEIARLATSLNRLLTALDTARRQQRRLIEDAFARTAHPADQPAQQPRPAAGHRPGWPVHPGRRAAPPAAGGPGPADERADRAVRRPRGADRPGRRRRSRTKGPTWPRSCTVPPSGSGRVPRTTAWKSRAVRTCGRSGRPPWSARSPTCWTTR